MIKKIAMFLVGCMMLGAVMVACNNTEATDGSDTDSEMVTNESINTTESDKTVATDKQTEPAEAQKSIDIYIIAGQSNAAGHTRYDESVLRGLWSKYSMGSSNVLYAGAAEYTLNVNTPDVSSGVNEFQTWVPAKAGMGKGDAFMGAEVGMASYLSSTYYTGDKVAGIIKFAHGGTSLLNNLGGENAASGNWVSPSYAESLGMDYTRLTGGLYRSLISQVERSITLLENEGYEIHIKGVFWMQGESDVGKPSDYERAFKYFVDDLRKDLGIIMGEDLSDLAIMVGEISETSGSASESTVAKNNAFIAMQRSLAENMDNVYVIPSAQFHVNWIDESGANANGQDSWHWTTKDMFDIGELVGKCIVENILAE